VTERPLEQPLDLIRLFETLDRHDVSYLVVGGVAVQVHGHRRTTKDLDLAPEPSKENLRRLSVALSELKARVAGSESDEEISPTDPERLGLAAVVPPLVTTHGEVHILNDAKGAAPWSEMRSRALVVDLDGIEVAVIGLDDLIRMKRASGRPSDLQDIAFLTALEEVPEEP
jgi:hypothetical protein